MTNLSLIVGGEDAAPSCVCDLAIVDDEALIRQGLVAVAERLGYSALDFGDQPEVAEAIIRCRPKLVFLDLSLGRNDAIALMRELSIREFPGVVQLMSGLDAQTIAATHAIGVRLGLRMAQPVAKPFQEEVVAGVLRTVLPQPRPDSAVLFDVSEALVKGWLEVWYQPKINLQRRVLAGAEALLRLRHPELGVLPPSRFIPSFMSTSYDDMTAFVFETVARDWKTLNGIARHLPVSINASAGLIGRSSFLEMLTSAWPTAVGRPPVLIEISEDEAIEDLQAIRDASIQLRLHGAALSIDDFGKGHSTFARLRDLPFSEIKLDRSFVAGCATDARQRSLCAATVALARDFDMVAVAEGVEDKDDCATVQELGFHVAQGFYFARPSPLSDFKTLLERRRRPAVAVRA